MNLAILRRAFFPSLLLVLQLASRSSAQQPAADQEPTPTFPAGVEQVTVDVVVVDKEGQPVTGLSAADFEVYEDGVRQKIAGFDTFEAPPAATSAHAAPPPPPRISTNAERPEVPGRTFVLVFDDVHMRPYTAQHARGAVAEFLNKETRDGDRVTLVAASGGTWWSTRLPEGREELLSLLKRLDGLQVPENRKDWLSDYEAMRIYLFHDNMILDRVQRRFETYGLMTMTDQSQHVRDLMATEDPVVTSRAAEVYYTARSRNQVTLGTMQRALDSLTRLRGRKSMVLVSDGFVYDTHLLEFKRIVDAARRANVTIYFVNSRGLDAIPDALSADVSPILPSEDLGFAFSEEAETTEGSQSLALDTGGFTVRNSNDLAAGLKRISDETRAYYLIGYNPTNAARDGAFRKIEVKLPGRRGLQVRARRGYYAPGGEAAAAKPGTDPAFQAALDSPYEQGDIPLRMTHFIRDETALDHARVFVAAEVDVSHLDLREENGQSKGALEYLLLTVQRDNGRFFRFDQSLDLALDPQTRQELTRTWLPIAREMELQSGRYRAKIVVRDKTSGRIGTVVHDFAVPDLKPFRVSTPVLSDVREEGQGRLPILVRRDFPPGDRLYCQVDVYRAVREEGTGLPRVSMSYQVRRSDGALLTSDPPSLINPTPDGSVSRMIGFSLEGAAPGDYDLVMRFKDEFSGSRLEVHEPFSVEARTAATAQAR